MKCIMTLRSMTSRDRDVNFASFALYSLSLQCQYQDFSSVALLSLLTHNNMRFVCILVKKLYGKHSLEQKHLLQQIYTVIVMIIVFCKCHCVSSSSLIHESVGSESVKQRLVIIYQEHYMSVPFTTSQITETWM